MSTKPAIERFKKELFDILDETFENHHGIYLDRGTSLFETLRNVSSREASRSSSEKSATIAAQVRHVCFYLDVIEAFVLNKPIGKVDWREIWVNTREVNDVEWDQLRGELQQTAERTMATLKQLGTWEGENDIGGALAILAHTAYHLGGIRQALSVIKSQP